MDVHDTLEALRETVGTYTPPHIALLAQAPLLVCDIVGRPRLHTRTARAKVLVALSYKVVYRSGNRAVIV